MVEQQITSSQNIISTILSSLPPDAAITRVEYEGPRIALYTKNLKFLRQNNYIISDIVNAVKRRVVIRPDNSLRMEEESARETLASAVPDDASVSRIFFDDVVGEVTVEAGTPKMLLGNNGFDLHGISDKIGWIIKVKKAPHIKSSSLDTIYSVLKSEAKGRKEFYKNVGENIFRPRLSSGAQISLLTLGGFHQVGRSCLLLTTPESKILLDCGIHPSVKNPWDASPRLDWADIDLDELDAVVMSHAHLDHSGYLPVLFKYGYRGPVYCTDPTLALMTLLHMDYVKISNIEGGHVLYEPRDVRKMIEHTITIPFNLVTDISPDVKMVLNNAGHILGSATVHLHVGDGLHNIVYTGDFKFGRTMLFDATTWDYPRVETLIMESTYGAKEDIVPNREEIESILVNSINKTLSDGGKVLIPTPAVGRAQEIMLVLDNRMRNGNMTSAPIFLEGMISEATAIHVAYPEFLSRDLRDDIASGSENPFLSDYFTVIEHHSKREEALRDGPAIIMATSGMLEGGPVLRYFEQLVPEEKNKLLFVSYQIAGTMGRRILDGARQVSILGDEGKIKIINIGASVQKIDGFSGHSDYNQLIRFVGKVRPKLQRVIVNHGEKSKIENLANSISRIYRIPVFNPAVQEAIRLF